MKNQDIARAAKTWSPDTRDEFEERAAIVEYDGNQTRTNAELKAYLEVMKIKSK